MNISEKQERKEEEAGKGEKNEDKSEYTDVYTKINKADVVDEAKCFDSKQVEEQKCTDILAKIIYLANHVKSAS